MLKEVKIAGLRQSDKVFKIGAALVKVRLEKREIATQKKLHGPSAVSFCFTASVCDNTGRAVRLSGERVAVCPHSLTIPLSERKIEKKAVKEQMEAVIAPLIQKAIEWHENLTVLETITSEWNNDPGEPETS